MVLCLIFECSNKIGNNNSGREKKRLFRVPRVVTSHDDLVEDADSTQFLVKEIQTTPAYFEDDKTQTSGFEYLFKETKTQPFTDDYFDSDDKVCFYTG